jgi:hypothetical protein
MQFDDRSIVSYALLTNYIENASDDEDMGKADYLMGTG